MSLKNIKRTKTSVKEVAKIDNNTLKDMARKRTTIFMSDEIRKSLKLLSVNENTSMGELIEKALKKTYNI